MQMQMYNMTLAERFIRIRNSLQLMTIFTHVTIY